MFRYFCKAFCGRSLPSGHQTLIVMSYTLNIRGCPYIISEPKVMGVLNLTPDSFYSFSRTKSSEAAINRVRTMMEAGMDILDVGAVSSRPGAEFPDETEERTRLEEPLKAIIKEFPNLIISVDTFRSGIAQLCADLGVHIINDISGGTYDPDMFPTMGRLQLPYVLMHLDGTPVTMQENPHYEDVVTDLLAYFSERMQQARMAGIHDIIVDPGFGFAKTTAQNYRLLAHLDDFRMLQAPVLAGMSRKSMLYKLLDCTPDDALNATTAANMLALMKGVAILRVHDVKEAVESVKIFKQFKYFGENNPDEAQPQA